MLGRFFLYYGEIMNRKLYVGNLGFDVTEEEVKELFGTYGEVQEVKMISDRYTGRPRGFAFVTLATPEAATQALEALNGQPFHGRNLAIDIARSETRDRKPEGGGGRDFNREDRRERGNFRNGNNRNSFSR
jgi:RNA recognition motif-containing protein